ncbi:MAG: transketolase C-terminal domain-containing protein [Spirochaetia bacterium]
MLGNYRDALGRAFIEMGNEFRDLVIVTADVSKSTQSIRFKQLFPDRFFSVGIAEQNAVGVAAGMATFGIPVIYTAYAMFATAKPFEQVRNMVAYPRLNVKIVATHGGINVGEDGVTHQAIEDVAIMRAIPGMTVVAVADPGEVTAALRAAIQREGPVYLRLPRASSEIIHKDEGKLRFVIGKAETLREGSDVTLMAIGMMVHECLRAAESLAAERIQARVLNIRTVKPLDEEAVLAAARETRGIVTAEDHNCMGGLGGAVAEVLVRNYPVPMEQVAVMDVFGRSGEARLLMKSYRLTAEEICLKAKTVLQRSQERSAHHRAVN